MHQLLINITEEQKKMLFEIKKQTDIHVSVQIRKAIDIYLKQKEKR